MSDPVRIVLVEDNKVFREALELLLGLRSDVEVVAAIGDGTEAVPACIEFHPEVVLMDFRLPNMDGVQATAAVKEATPEVAVVCLTATASGAEVDALVAVGAVACLRKDQELDEIVAAIHVAAAGRLARAE
ncbi:MAG: response regulator transcription factor [Thermoleophilia bacterium]